MSDADPGAQPGAANGQRGIFTPELLDRCISCGFCLPACPTYALTKDERVLPARPDQPDAALETGELAADDPTARRARRRSAWAAAPASRCARPACSTASCWSMARPPVARRAQPPVARAAADGGRRTARWSRRLGRPASRRARATAAGSRAGAGRRRDARRLMLGCFERGAVPRGEPGRAARCARSSPCPRTRAAAARCTRTTATREPAATLARELGERLPGTIVTTAGGCAAHLADVLGRDRVRELSSTCVSTRTTRARRASGSTGAGPGSALQDSCHLRNGLGVWQEPRRAAGAASPTTSSCRARRVLRRGRHLLAAAPARTAAGSSTPSSTRSRRPDLDYVVAVNPGCLAPARAGLRRRGLRTRVVHLAELAAERR